MKQKPNTLNRFVRFGKLALVKQKGFGKDTFHSPPAPRGFYAMPLRYQEYFLIGSIDDFQPGQLNAPKKPDNEASMEEWVEWNHKWDKRFKAVRHEFTVENEVELWHHLTVPNNEVISRHHSWIKTSLKAWKKAVSKESTKLRAEAGGERGINSVYKRTGYTSKDHFEVFFDTKVI
jgi:hypothetical protein